MADANGINGYCNLFDASTQNIVFGTGDFNFERTDSFSISCWIKRTNVNKWGTFFGKFNATPVGWYWIVNNSNNMILNLYSTALSKLEVSGGLLNTAGVWYHIVLTYAGTSLASGVKMYQNGTGQTITKLAETLSSSIVNNGTSWISYKSGIGDPLDARMDELGIYTRVLTQDDVTQLYNSGAGKFY
jgi:hypothetical protein